MKKQAVVSQEVAIDNRPRFFETAIREIFELDQEAADTTAEHELAWLSNKNQELTTFEEDTAPFDDVPYWHW